MTRKQKKEKKKRAVLQVRCCVIPAQKRRREGRGRKRATWTLCSCVIDGLCPCSSWLSNMYISLIWTLNGMHKSYSWLRPTYMHHNLYVRCARGTSFQINTHRGLSWWLSRQKEGLAPGLESLSNVSALIPSPLLSLLLHMHCSVKRDEAQTGKN